MHPLGYFVSAPSGTADAAILDEMISRYGDYLEKLDSEQKLALRAVLSFYLLYKLKYVSGYSISDVVIDAMPEFSAASISKILLALEGISTNNAEGLLKFLTDQRSELATAFGKAAPYDQMHPMKSQKVAVVERITTLQKQLQQMSRNHQTELDTLQLQMQTDWEAANRELTSLKAVVSSQHSNGSGTFAGTTQGGSQ